MTHPNKDVATNAAAVAHTQHDIAATLAALQDRMQPTHLLSDAGHALADGALTTSWQATQGVRDLIAALQRQVQDAPMVAAILGAATAWLTSASQHAQDAGQTAAERAQTVAQNLTEQAQQHAGDLASAAQQHAGEAVDRAQAQIKQDVARLENAASEHPWLVGALAVALGLGIAVALPQTAQEREWYHHARAALGKQVMGLLHDTLGSLHDPSAPAAGG